MNGKVFLLMFLGTLGLALSSSPQMFGATGGCDCPSKHPQQKFCDDSLVIKATVVHVGRAESTGGNDGMNMDMVVVVNVNEVFKGNDSIYQENINLHTYRMCQFGDMLSRGQEYIFSATDIYQPGYFVVQRGCNWVQKWDELQPEQIDGLNGDYYDCYLCEITKTPSSPMDDYSFLKKSPLEDEQEPIGSCFHNQQMAMGMRRYVDCESLYSACVVRESDCYWRESPAYRRCMKKRTKELKRGRNRAKYLPPPRRLRKPKSGNRRTLL